jgi:ComF family protein
VKDRFKGIIPLQKAGAFLYYNKNEMIKEMLHQMKYNQNGSLAFQMGKICGRHLKDAIVGAIDVIIPIPLHSTKLMQRGYNQTEIFGSGLSEEIQVPIETKNIIRVKNTSSQTMHSRENRFVNVQNIFELRHQHTLQDKRILLIDDVITTGATLESAGRVLLSANPKSLNILTLASAFEL